MFERIVVSSFSHNAEKKKLGGQGIFDNNLKNSRKTAIHANWTSGHPVFSAVLHFTETFTETEVLLFTECTIFAFEVG